MTASLISPMQFILLILGHQILQSRFSTSSCISKLTTSNDCFCSEKSAIFKCSVVGTGTTIWQGSAFNCTSRGIQLLHISNNFEGAVEICNNGAIKGRGLSILGDNCFISQINITMSHTFNEKTIQCVHDDGSSTREIGNYTLGLSSDPYPPPDNIHIEYIGKGLAAFAWNTLAVNCQELVYHVLAINCGDCPREIIHPYRSVTCTNMTLDGRICTFSIQTKVCDHLFGDASQNLSLVLLTPSPPLLHVIPQYSNESKKLYNIHVSFKQLEAFNISSGVDGSAQSYVITYSDPTSGNVCGSSTIQALSCEAGMCSHVFDISSSSSCPQLTDITVTAFAISSLGDGLSSQPITIESYNNLVGVEFNLQTLVVVCRFLRLQVQDSRLNIKSCNMSYGPSCDNLIFEAQHKTVLNNSSSILIALDTNIIITGGEYCFIVSASNGTYPVNIKGSLFKPGIQNDNTSTSNSILFMILFGLSGAINVLLITILVVWVTLKLKLSSRKLSPNNQKHIIEMKPNEVYGVRFRSVEPVSAASREQQLEVLESFPHAYETVKPSNSSNS